MYCASCGTELIPGNLFCTGCGKKIDNHTESESAFKPAPSLDEPPASFVYQDDSPEFKIPEFSTVAAPTNDVTLVSPKTKNVQMIIFGFWVALFVVCMAITAIFEWALKYDECIQISSTFDGGASKYISLSEILHYMYNGYAGFAPTVSSTLLSVLVYALKYSLPILMPIMFIGTVINNSKLWHTALSILNILSAVTLIIIMPLTLHFVPNITTIIGAEVSILAEDIGAISYTVPIVLAVIIIALIIGSYILLFLLLRRKENEKICAYIK